MVYFSTFMTSQIHLRPDERQVIDAILAEQIPTLEVRAFGSRVSGRMKPMSDLDLFVVDHPPLSSAMKYRVAEAFSESLLPFKVDLSYESEISERFRSLLNRSSVQFAMPQLGQNRENASR